MLRKQQHYALAIEQYRDAIAVFEQTNEPQAQATIWHHLGMLYQSMNENDDAEDAYRHSLELKTQQNDMRGRANSLGQLGNLYENHFNRIDEAIIFYRQAATLYQQLEDTRSEGFCRSNLADSLFKLKRFNEASIEIQLAIEKIKPFGNSAEPWFAWSVLENIETASNRPNKAKQAKTEAILAYKLYRQQGGFAQFESGKLADKISVLLKEGQIDKAQKVLNQQKTSANLKSFIDKLLMVVGGCRDIDIADGLELSFDCSAEILLLIERLKS